jgi:iron complex outermembrane receptor protein
MKFSRTALSCGVSRAAIVTSMLLIAQAANAQPAEQGVESVTVTGTNIRGAVPVGSHVATVGQQEIEALAPTSVTGVLASLPQLSTSGTAAQGENSYTFYSPNIHNLAASASNSTLVTVDGMRIPGGGSQWAQSDPNIIPVVALQRVEVLADGASSIYGSDAVSGVVNFITRKSFDGIQLDAQAGFGNGYQTDNLDVLWGTHWDSGNVFVAAAYAFGTNITLADRPFVSRGDYTALGGNNQQSTACPTASIHPTSPATSGNSYWFMGPTGNGFANTQAARPCNNSIYGDVLPQTQRTNAMMKATQDFFGGRLTISETLVYNDLHTVQQSGPGTLTATVYGNGSGKGGQINPFFQAPTGAPTTTAEQVSWVNRLSPLPTLTTTENVIYNRLNATYAITDNWHFDLDWVLGQNNYISSTTNGFCASCAYLALNGTALSGGSTTGTDISGRNVIALNTPLTNANALDVWSPLGSNQTSQNVIRSLSSNNSTTPIYNSTNQLRASVNGSLFALPAGDVKVAIGGENYVQHIIKDQVSANNTGPSSSGSGLLRYRYHRVVQSGFAEVQVPVISPEMNVPLIHKLSIDVSGRIDSFSDVGTTSNPKYAVDWEVTSDLKLRANYSQSFVAPPLLSLGDPTYGYTYQGGAASGGQLDSIPAANFPGIQNIPGAVCTINGAASTTPASTGCPLVSVGNTAGTGGIGGTGGNQGLERQYGGLFVNVKPQTGITWSVGVDYNPSWLDGFHSSVTLFNTTFKGAVNAAHIQQTANVPSLFKFFQVCNNGAGCTQAQVDTFTNTANGATTGALPAGPIYYLYAHDETNFLYLRVQGIDFDASYDVDMGDYGNFHIGDYLTLFTQFKEGYDGANYFSIKGTSGFNGTFASLEYNTRLNLGWTLGPWGIDAFVNYMPGYHNWNSTSVTPLNPNALGVPTAGDKVGSWTTLDLNMSYSFADGWLGGDQVYVHVNNVFDQDPPFINTTANGAGASSGAAFGFNAFNSSPIGRTVSIGMRAKF